MINNKIPLIIANFKSTVSTLTEVKNILKDLNKEYLILLKAKSKIAKKKFIRKELVFNLAIPAPFIYPLNEFIKNNKIFKKVLIGNQGFDYIEKTNTNNSITFPQIKNVGAKFVILNNQNFYYTNLKKISPNIDTLHKENKLTNTHSIILDRLNAVSKKFSEKSSNILEFENEPAENLLEIKKNNEKQMHLLEEKVKFSLLNKMSTVVVLPNLQDDLDSLTKFIKNLIKDIHYNLLNNLIICYKEEYTVNNLDILNIESTQEKVIAIRRTIANLYGIDNAKKVKILYQGFINNLNILEMLEIGGVDGVLLNEESVNPKYLAKILVEIA